MQARHLQIGHQRVHGVAVSEDCQRLAAITRSGDSVTQLREKFRIDGEQEQIVVNEEDGGLHGTSRTADQAGAHASLSRPAPGAPPLRTMESA